MDGSSDRPRWRTRPTHPPFTDFPLAAYIFAAAFDVISAMGGSRHHWTAQLWHAGTFVLVAGLGSCLITVATGFLDLFRFPARSAAAARTAVTHVCVMGGVFMLGTADLVWRLTDYSTRSSTPVGLVALSLAVAIAVGIGACYGGQLVFGHGIGVRADILTADDHEPIAALAPPPDPAHERQPPQAAR